jgi:hypothetical protein
VIVISGWDGWTTNSTTFTDIFGTLKEALSAHVVLRVFAEDAGRRPGIFEIDMGLVCSVLHGVLTNTHELPKLTALFVKDF